MLGICKTIHSPTGIWLQCIRRSRCNNTGPISISLCWRRACALIENSRRSRADLLLHKCVMNESFRGCQIIGNSIQYHFMLFKIQPRNTQQMCTRRVCIVLHCILLNCALLYSMLRWTLAIRIVQKKCFNARCLPPQATTANTKQNHTHTQRKQKQRNQRTDFSVWYR